MSFAYIQGREAEALAFFEKRLQVSRDQSERDQLTKVVEELRNALRERGEKIPDDLGVRSLSLSYSCS